MPQHYSTTFANIPAAHVNVAKAFGDSDDQDAKEAWKDVEEHAVPFDKLPEAKTAAFFEKIEHFMDNNEDHDGVKA